MPSSKDKVYFDLGIVFITVGGFFVAISSVKDQINIFHTFSDKCYYIIIGLSIALFAGGLLLIFLSYCDLSGTSTFIDYDMEIAKFGDLKTLHKLCLKKLGNDVINFPLMTKIFSRNNEVFIKVIETKTRGRRSSTKIVGFFDILPLDARTSQELEEGLLNSGALLSNKILPKHEAAMSIYVGGVFATSFRAKAATLAFLKAEINKHIQHGAKMIYARPTTDVGFRLVHNSGFSPIQENSNDKLNQIYHKFL